jgi:hypothetical protein
MGLLIVAGLVMPACSGGTSDASDAGPVAVDADISVKWLPLAPTENDFSWQGSQRRLVEDSPSQRPCAGADIALAMWERAVCYGARNGELMCAGQIGTTVFGPNFVPAGLQNVVQLLGSPTFGPDTGNAVCALKNNGTAWCLGYGGSFGQFRTADGMQPGAEWTQWGDRNDISELSTGTMDSICARYSDKTADCAGYMAPTITDNNVRSLWIDTFATVHVNEQQVFRVGNSRSSCVVVPQGLACSEPADIAINLQTLGAPMTPYGVLVTQTSDAGKVVDGNAADFSHVCWLTASGSVTCLGFSGPLDPLPETAPTASEHFVGKRALALAVNGYSRDADRCAAMSDGSLWCVGGNYGGKLGSGSEDALVVETQVQPPGSVRINCGQAP